MLAAASTAALATALFMPNAASAGPVEDLLNQVNETLQGLSGGGGSGGGGGGGGATPQSGTPGVVPPAEDGYIPPAHGTNPHGQGTVATGDVPYDPDEADPLPDEEDGPETLVAGRSRGEQNGDEYHGHITIVALGGSEILGRDQTEGEDAEWTGPLAPVAEGLIDPFNGAFCPADPNLTLCLLASDMSTDESGSTNHFEAARANLGGPTGISATAASSDGNVSDDGECQSAEGGSEVTDASIGGDAVTAEVLESNSTSTACNNGTPTQENTSTGIVELNDQQILPICDATAPPGEPNDPSALAIPGLLGAVCAADDSNGSQMPDPYGVREAFTAVALQALLPVKLTTAASESHAVAPGGDAACPDPTNPDCPGPDGPGDGDGDGDDADGDVTGGPGEGGPPGGPLDKGPGDDELAFTGADMLTMLLIGGSVMGVGLLLMALADRRRRETS